MYYAVTGGALIQSTFGSGNFESVVFLGPTSSAPQDAQTLLAGHVPPGPRVAVGRW